MMTQLFNLKSVTLLGTFIYVLTTPMVAMEPALSEGSDLRSTRSAIAMGVFPESNVSEIQEIIGYHFKNPVLLKAAFCHSSVSGASVVSGVRGDTTFERLEFVGDKIIGGLVASRFTASSSDFEKFRSEKEMHNHFKSKTKNTYFSKCYQDLGLSRFLVFNTKNKKGKVYADAFEALVGAMSLDLGTAMLPSSRELGLVFETLSPIVERMMTPKIIEILPTVLAAAEGPAVSAKQLKVQEEVTLTVRISDGKLVTKKGAGHGKSKARRNVIKAIWGELSLPLCKAKDKKWVRFNEECGKRSYVIEEVPGFPKTKSKKKK